MRIGAACLLLSVAMVRAETGEDAWLRYAPVAQDPSIPAVVAVLSRSAVLDHARDELIRGVRGMFGRTLRIEYGVPRESAIVLVTLADATQILPAVRPDIAPDGYSIQSSSRDDKTFIVITALNDRGILYGVFALLRRMALGRPLANWQDIESPSVALRWVNQWDNLDGSVERGYGGRSIFWEDGRARGDLSRVAEYGRLLASVGINGCSINNVNADPRVLTPAFIPQIARIAEALRPWGVQVVLSVDFGSPKSAGDLDTFDPLDPRVAAWWKTRVDELYRAVPDVAGFVMKADSEGRSGPSAYGRTQADAANVVARALKPHGGVLLYRTFVYNHHLDWRNLKNDRARAAYDIFQPLDGRFDENIILQVKNGPIDFQVREPVSPLFGGMQKTNEAMEVQVTQEYTGQARHCVFLVPMWKEALDFDTHARGGGTPVKSLIRGLVGVANVGLDANWLGNHLSQANLYGFGRLAWDPGLTSEAIIDEWTRQTFGSDAKVLDTIAHIQLASWRTYEHYTGPLGLQTLTDITGNHYGPAVEASERNGWGQWHRADAHGVGMDRTVATGTGFIGQYRPAVARMYESLQTCPDDLLLFFHHVPYTYVLHSGTTVIQSIYDSHYEGAAAVADYARRWEGLRGLVDDQRYQAVLRQLEYQAGDAQLWRDAVSSWFLRESGIPDAHGRVGHYPGRVEAESTHLEGYTVVDVMPWEAASGGKAVMCPRAECTAVFAFHGAPGWYRLEVRYFDQNNGVSRFRLFVGSKLVDKWAADDHLPTAKIDGSSSTRRVISGVALRPGDKIRIEGTPDRGEAAALDYVEVNPQR